MTKITLTPEEEALYNFDVENNVEPARTIAERIADGYRLSAKLRQSLEDEISHAIEDARDVGRARTPFEIAARRSPT